MRISDWSSDVCSSDLFRDHPRKTLMGGKMMLFTRRYALGMLGAGMGMGAGMGVGLRSAPAFGQDTASRALEGHSLGTTLATPVPAIAGLTKGLPELGSAPHTLPPLDPLHVMHTADRRGGD